MDATEKKTMFDKVKNYFADKFKTIVEVKEKFEELLLVDGTTKVTVEPSLEIGSAIALYDAEGNPIPAPAGAYELQDGRVIVVEVDGVIAAINDKVAEEELEETPASNDEASKVKELIERIETVSKYAESVKEDFKKVNEDLKAENVALRSEVADLTKFVKETLETLLAEPAKEPVQKFSNPFGSAKGNNYLQTINKK